MAALTAKSQSEISEILAGQRVTSVEVIERIADGLGGGALRMVRRRVQRRGARAPERGGGRDAPHRRSGVPGAGADRAQGYNVGRPPYGYVADKIPHPVPARREQGNTKSRLVPDPVRAAVVREIYDLYLNTGMGLDLIRDRLNADPVAYPPPVPPDPRRSLGAWSSSSIRDILHNPKYTGYMIWNRRARKGGRNRINPQSEWVWSPVPMHEPLISMDEFQAVQGKASANEGSRRTGPDEQQRAQRAIYLYRGLVRCGICGLRMTGTIRRNATGRYYFCYPNKQRRQSIPSEHPKTVYLPEPALHQAVTGWLATAILGPDRGDYWKAALAAAGDDDTAHADRDARTRRLAEIDTTIADLTRRLHRQILNLEDDHLAGAARQQIAARIGEIEADLATHRVMADQLRSRDEPESTDPEEIAAALDRLPQLADGLAEMPEPALRDLYESLDLQLRYHPGGRCVDIQVTLADGPSHDRLVPPVGHNVVVRARPYPLGSS